MKYLFIAAVIPVVLMLQLLPAPGNYLPNNWVNHYENVRTYFGVLKNLYEFASKPEIAPEPVFLVQTRFDIPVVTASIVFEEEPIEVDLLEPLDLEEAVEAEREMVQVKAELMREQIQAQMACQREEIRKAIKEFQKFEKKYKTARIPLPRRASGRFDQLPSI